MRSDRPKMGKKVSIAKSNDNFASPIGTPNKINSRM
jgi:hypothetical protein